MTKARLALLVAVVLPARADRQEHRLSIAAGASLSAMQAGGVSTSAPSGGARVRYAYGLANSVELAGSVGLTVANNIEFPHAVVDGEQGNLFVDIYAPELALGVRFIPGVALSRWFTKIRPLLGTKLGARVDWRRNADLLDDAPGNDNKRLSRPDDVLYLQTFAGLEVGVEVRLSPALVVGIVTTADVSTAETTTVGVQLELGHHFY